MLIVLVLVMQNGRKLTKMVLQLLQLRRGSVIPPSPKPLSKGRAPVFPVSKKSNIDPVVAKSGDLGSRKSAQRHYTKHSADQ